MFGAGYQYSHKIFSHFEFPQELTVLELDFSFLVFGLSLNSTFMFWALHGCSSPSNDLHKGRNLAGEWMHSGPQPQLPFITLQNKRTGDIRGWWIGSKGVDYTHWNREQEWKTSAWSTLTSLHKHDAHLNPQPMHPPQSSCRWQCWKVDVLDRNLVLNHEQTQRHPPTPAKALLGVGNTVSPSPLPTGAEPRIKLWSYFVLTLYLFLVHLFVFSASQMMTWTTKNHLLNVHVSFKLPGGV